MVGSSSSIYRLECYKQTAQVPSLSVAATLQVAADCQKYEAYVHGSQSLAAKLSNTHTRLLQQLEASSNNSSSNPTSQQQEQHQQEQQHTYLQLQLRLCSVLRAAVSDSLPPDSLQWLAALELPDPAAVALQQQWQRERELVAAIDAAVNKPGGFEGGGWCAWLV